MHTLNIKVGDSVEVMAYKSDGACYRSVWTTVEALDHEVIVLTAPAGHMVYDINGDWWSRHAIRVYYWIEKWYSLLEVYAPDGGLYEIYVNLNSPVEIGASRLRFTDYELDVSRIPPESAVIVDQDEFQAAAVQYGYSEAFQQACWQAADEAVRLANRWIARGMPQ